MEPDRSLGIKEVLEKFQIQKVSQVIDFLGMMGDSVDNIPGLAWSREENSSEIYCSIWFYGSFTSKYS